MKQFLLVLLALSAMKAQAQYAPAPAVPASLTTIAVNDEGENLLADTKGNTLYVFDLDLNKPTSACAATCAEMWPPYLVTADEIKALQAPFAAITRDSKKMQLTYEGSPVYTYALDRGVAADAGDGVGGVWHYVEIEN